MPGKCECRGDGNGLRHGYCFVPATQGCRTRQGDRAKGQLQAARLRQTESSVGCFSRRRYIVLCLYVKVIMLTVLFLAFYLENGSGKALRRNDLGPFGHLVGKVWDWLTRPEPDRGELDAVV